MDVHDHEDSSTTRNNTIINNNDNNHNNQNNNQPNKNPALDQSGPYCLHHVENPNEVLVSLQLSENSYESWSRSMKQALLSKNKIKFINNKLTAPQEDDPLFDTLGKCNNIVLS